MKEILAIDISKEQQSSYWGTDALDENQINYAKQDVLYLHQIKKHLDNILKREDRYDIFEKMCYFLPARCELDNMGWEDIDPFSHYHSVNRYKESYLHITASDLSPTSNGY